MTSYFLQAFTIKFSSHYVVIQRQESAITEPQNATTEAQNATTEAQNATTELHNATTMKSETRSQVSTTIVQQYTRIYVNYRISQQVERVVRQQKAVDVFMDVIKKTHKNREVLQSFKSEGQLSGRTVSYNSVLHVIVYYCIDRIYLWIVCIDRIC